MNMVDFKMESGSCGEVGSGDEGVFSAEG